MVRFSHHKFSSVINLCWACMLHERDAMPLVGRLTDLLACSPLHSPIQLLVSCGLLHSAAHIRDGLGYSAVSSLHWNHGSSLGESRWRRITCGLRDRCDGPRDRQLLVVGWQRRRSCEHLALIETLSPSKLRHGALQRPQVLKLLLPHCLGGRLELRGEFRQRRLLRF